MSGQMSKVTLGRFQEIPPVADKLQVIEGLCATNSMIAQLE